MIKCQAIPKEQKWLCTIEMNGKRIDVTARILALCRAINECIMYIPTEEREFTFSSKGFIIERNKAQTSIYVFI